MYRTERLRNDHAELNDRLDSLEVVLSSELLAGNPHCARQRVIDLMTKLLCHLAVERDVLCPHLRRFGDAKVVGVSDRFDQRLDTTVAAVKQFNHRWMVPRWIAQAPDRYVAEAVALVADLRDLLRRELDELYPTAEAA